MLDSSVLETDPPNVGAWHLFEDSAFLANHLPRHRICPLNAILAKSEQSGTKSGTSTIYRNAIFRINLYKLLILLVPGGGLEPPRPCGLRILSPLRLPV